jgi:hypothetical protein
MRKMGKVLRFFKQKIECSGLIKNEKMDIPTSINVNILE